MRSLARAPRARLGALLRHHLGARATRALSALSEIIWLAVASNNAGRPVFLSALGGPGGLVDISREVKSVSTYFYRCGDKTRSRKLDRFF